MYRTVLTLTVTFAGLLSSAALYAEQEVSTDPETGLISWQWRGEGVDLTFNQRLPDQTRAYFQGRGFQPDEAELIATDCLFQAIVRTRTENKAPLELDLTQWRVVVDNEARPLKLKHEWQQLWERLEVASQARIAFQWSLFPTRQNFAPGDWNMGMITLGLSPGDRFDLQIAYQLKGETVQAHLRELQCAPDKQM